MGLLGFRREIQSLKDKVDAKKKEIEELINERRVIQDDIQLGRTLLDIDHRIQKLEQRLMIASNHNLEEGQGDEETVDRSESEDDSEDESATGVPTSRLQRHAQQYLHIRKLADKVGLEHPYLAKQQERMMSLKYTVLLDLSNALKQSTGAKDVTRIMRILGIYREMDEAGEAVKILKASKA